MVATFAMLKSKYGIILSEITVYRYLKNHFINVYDYNVTWCQIKLHCKTLKLFDCPNTTFKLLHVYSKRSYITE